jgi:hypothetical protein
MWDLIQIYLGEATIIDHSLSLADCLRAAAEETFIADGMATFICETET